jgi:Mg-chelatase subunit ChlD
MITKEVLKKFAPKKKGLYVHVLLDRSGSMQLCRDSTIKAFNEYIKGLKTDDSNARVSLTLFDDRSIDNVFSNSDVNHVKDLDRETFVPRGNTPLNDAIGKTIGVIEDSKIRGNVALVILTDGEENASREHTSESVKTLLDRAQNQNGWLVIYLGTGHDVWKAAKEIGVPIITTLPYSREKTGETMSAALRSTMSYSVGASTAFTDDERKKAIE